MIDINKLTDYIDLVNNASTHVTLNTLENIYNKLENITNDNFIVIRNYNSLLLQAETIPQEEIKKKIINNLTNQLEQYVSQV